VKGGGPGNRSWRGVGIVASLVLVVVGALWWSRSDSPPTASVSAAPREATFLGRAACAECHPNEAARWKGSHHDLAMAVADETSVRGAFDGATFTYEGVTSRFYRRDGKYFVWTDGPDGTEAEFEITHTFGWSPLQQYLIPMGGGRRQVLGIAWDARPASMGGQRWFHLYPGEHVTHDDVLHWTRPSQSWNDRCARCHSTDLRKGYRADTDTYETTAAEIDVACEACHGAGSTHVAWARGGGTVRGAADGLRVRFDVGGAATWDFVGAAPIARRSPPRTSEAELETCAPCHARRGELGSGAAPGAPFLDGYRPALLDEGLYFADGQIRDEVYEWGSFLQSPMHQAGVTCSDCHDPHSLDLRAEGNALCTRCHLSGHYDTTAHHFHQPGSPAAACVTCHMPSRTYMQIHVRHDHGLRVPRPDLASETGGPDVCTSCHTDRTPEWAADAIARRPGPHRAGTPHFGQVIAAGRRGAIDAKPRLLDLVGNPAMPGIVRATAVGLLPDRSDANVEAALARAVADGDPLVRLAGVNALDGTAPAVVAARVTPLLGDPIRAVRLEAASVVGGLPTAGLDPSTRSTIAKGLDEYRASVLANADRPEAHLALGLLETKLGHAAEAERELATAIRIAPWFVPGYVNLADLYRATGRDGEGEILLRRAIAIAPENAEAHHALGLLLVRQHRLDDALGELERAATLQPAARNAYVLGVALQSAGKTARAIEVLSAAHDRHPADRDILVALVTINRDRGAMDEARRQADALVALAPNDPGARRLRDELAQTR